MVGGTLYSYPDNFRAYKALIAAEYSGAKVKMANNFVFGETNNSKDFLAKFPTGKVPAFESTDGLCLTESNAIAYYVANEQLRGGKDAVTQSLVLQWLNFADSDILPAACTWVFPCLGIMQFNKQQTERAKEDVKKALAALNDHLLNHTYLVGERITLADIVCACTLLSLYQNVLDPGFRNPYGNVNRWFTTIVNQPQAKKVLGTVKMADKMAQFDAKKFAEVQGAAAAGGKKDKKDAKKAEKQSGEKKKKEEKKKPEPEDDDDADVPDFPKEKAKDPMLAVPKGSWDMDDFKRFYSNNDEDKSVPYFWEKFDKDNYSIWRCDYKYNDELTMVFMSCNLIGGMFQRLDKLRKHAFGSCCLFGENNNSTISGIWVWRGPGLVFELSEDWQIDYSSYDWKKLDPNAQDTKDMVNKYLCWVGEDEGGRKFNQGKIFK